MQKHSILNVLNLRFWAFVLGWPWQFLYIIEAWETILDLCKCVHIWKYPQKENILPFTLKTRLMQQRNLDQEWHWYPYWWGQCHHHRPLCFLLCKPLVSFISMIYLLIPYNIRIYHLPQKDDIRRNASEIVIKADSVITIAGKIF